MRVHGLTTQFLSDKPQFGEIAQALVDYVAGAEIIIHNAPFDLAFLNMELARTGHRPFKEYVANVLDTLVMAKEMFPGKRNSLDALCDRLEVDNSGRTLHGALLDAELLADVYINMTRGQDALLMDASPSDSASSGPVVASVDLQGFVLSVLQANPQELAAHDEVLTQLDKSSNGKTALAAKCLNFRYIILVFPDKTIRAISSGVEHCIHTAGVASSKLASPTKYQKAPCKRTGPFFMWA